MNKVSEWIRVNREARLWTQEELGNLMAEVRVDGKPVSNQIISQWERGTRIPSFRSRRWLIRLFKRYEPLTGKGLDYPEM